MYSYHRLFETPPDETTVWKYMEFWKLMDLLHSRAIYFRRIDRLVDEYEADCDNLEVKAYLRSNKYVSCWHMSELESRKMWEEYGKLEGSVVIKSNISRIKRAISVSGISVFIGKTRYRDYRKNKPSMKEDANLYFPVIHKMRKYDYENEIRLCISSRDNANPPSLSPEDDRINVSLEDLIDEIFVYPGTTRNLFDFLKRNILPVFPKAKIKPSSLVGVDPISWTPYF